MNLIQILRFGDGFASRGSGAHPHNGIQRAVIEKHSLVLPARLSVTVPLPRTQ